MTRANGDLDRTNARQSHRPKRRPIQCFLPRLGRKPRDKRRELALLMAGIGTGWVQRYVR